MYANIDNVIDFTKNVKALLGEDGIFVVQTGYHPEQMKNNMFDYIYHEHLSYHSVEPLERFFEAHGMEMIGAYRVMTHGGSLRVCCQLKGGPHAIDGNVVKDLITRERKLGLNRVTTYKKFASDIDTIKNKLYSLKEKGKREINSNILQFIIKLKEAISKLKSFLLKNNFELKILIGTVIIKKNKIKLSNICKTSIMLT